MTVSIQDSIVKGWLHRGRLRDVVIIASVVSAWFFPLGGATLGLGLALLAAGCGLHVLVKGQLIRNVTLCTEGAYSVVRHPYYLANYLIDTSFCVLSGNAWLLVAYPFLFFWAYGPTLREEEARLASLHGSRFADYQASVPSVFPDRTMRSRLGRLALGFLWRRVTAEEWKRFFRFAYVGSLLVLVRQARADGWESLLFWRDTAGGVTLALAALCGALLFISIVIPRPREADPVASVMVSRDAA